MPSPSVVYKNKRVTLWIVISGLLLLSVVTGLAFYARSVLVGASTVECQIVDITPADKKTYTRGEIGLLQVAFTKGCTVPNESSEALAKVLDVEAGTPNLATIADLKGTRDNSENTNYSTTAYQPWTAVLHIYSVNAGTAKFTFDLKQGNSKVTKTFSTVINSQTNAGKMAPTTNGFVVHPQNPISVGFIGGTAPYTSRLVNLAVQGEDKTRGWTPVEGAEREAVYNNSLKDNIVLDSNGLTVKGASRALYAILEVTDSAGKKAEMSFYTMGRGTKHFTKTATIKVGEKVSYAFNTAGLMGDNPLAYVRGYDNSRVGLVKRVTVGEVTTYTFQGISAGTTKIVPWSIPPVDKTLKGESAWNGQSYGVVNVTVTGDGGGGGGNNNDDNNNDDDDDDDDSKLTCGTSGFKHKFVPNAWNIKTNYFQSQATNPTKIYELFNTPTRGTYASRIFAYVTAGRPYQENPSLTAVPPGMGYWFNSGASSPVCVEGVTLYAPTSGSVTLDKSLSMVGNMTGITKTWGDARITVNGRTMSLAEASREKLPIVKAMFTYTPGAIDYSGYYASVYGDYITGGGGQPIEALLSLPVAPGDGAWIALNSQITSATFSF